NFKIYSNPLFDDEEIISTKIDPHYFKAESNLIESLLNRDILIDSSPKFDFLLEEFSGELAHINLILPGIEEADFDLEEEIRLYSLSMGDENLSTIPKTESDKLIKSSVENLFLIPSEYEVTSDNESECDVPVNDESSLIFTSFLNPLFDCNDDFASSDDEFLMRTF
nr:hypothetical protein [Tanacetum cinerariifolium]